MKMDVTQVFLNNLRRRAGKHARRILRWFERNAWSGIVLQAGIFWFNPVWESDWIPGYVKLAVCRFMKFRYHAEYVEYLLPPAA